MCGVFGVLSNTKISPDSIGAATNLLIHRGPDEKGLFIKEPVHFGHRRLSIISLEDGQQPLQSECENYCITFNGEIYNYIELRDNLKQKGYLFRTGSDTEVILNAYICWGKSCLDHLRGMFAFSIADFKKRKCFLAVDHLGIKPLYYYSSNESFCFSSELHALSQYVKQSGRSLEVSPESIDCYLTLQYIPSPYTIYKDICKLPAGECLEISFDDLESRKEKYWSFSFTFEENKSEQEWIEELQAALKESVRCHMLADVEYGAFLSGGVDSSTVVALMSQISNKPVKTFSIGFKEKKYSELPYAEEAAAVCNTEHYSLIVEPDAIEMLPDLVKHYGEPFADSSALPTYYVSKLAGSHVKMALSGDGADELFAGYNRYGNWLKWLRFENLSLTKRAAYHLASAVNPEYYKREFKGSKYTRFINSMTYSGRKNLWRKEYRNVVHTDSIFPDLYEEIQGLDPLSAVQLIDINKYLPNCMLTKVDRASMMNSLEVRTPFVDIEIIRLAQKMPADIKVNCNGSFKGKSPLKKVCEKFFGKEFVKRPKMGFGTPIENWFGKKGNLREYVNDALLSENAYINNYFNGKEIRKYYKKNNYTVLWQLLFLEEWLKQNLS